jgi:hypothetical protein
MNIDVADYEELKELEESLWRPETRFNQAYLDRILAPDFFEFGRSGRIYHRAHTLTAPPQPINARLPLKNFSIHPIAENVVLVTYITEVTNSETQVSNRSSIWIKTHTGWQIRFHQGTPVNK